MPQTLQIMSFGEHFSLETSGNCGYWAPVAYEMQVRSILARGLRERYRWFDSISLFRISGLFLGKSLSQLGIWRKEEHFNSCNDPVSLDMPHLHPLVKNGL